MNKEQILERYVEDGLHKRARNYMNKLDQFKIQVFLDFFVEEYLHQEARKDILNSEDFSDD